MNFASNSEMKTLNRFFLIYYIFIWLKKSVLLDFTPECDMFFHITLLSATYTAL